MRLHVQRVGYQRGGRQSRWLLPLRLNGQEKTGRNPLSEPSQAGKGSRQKSHLKLRQKIRQSPQTSALRNPRPTPAAQTSQPDQSQQARNFASRDGRNRHEHAWSLFIRNINGPDVIHHDSFRYGSIRNGSIRNGSFRNSTVWNTAIRIGAIGSGSTHIGVLRRTARNGCALTKERRLIGGAPPKNRRTSK